MCFCNITCIDILVLFLVSVSKKFSSWDFSHDNCLKNNKNIYQYKSLKITLKNHKGIEMNDNKKEQSINNKRTENIKGKTSLWYCSKLFASMSRMQQCSRINVFLWIFVCIFSWYVRCRGHWGWGRWNSLKGSRGWSGLAGCYQKENKTNREKKKDWYDFLFSAVQKSRV